MFAHKCLMSRRNHLPSQQHSRQIERSRNLPRIATKMLQLTTASAIPKTSFKTTEQHPQPRNVFHKMFQQTPQVIHHHSRQTTSRRTSQCPSIKCSNLTSSLSSTTYGTSLKTECRCVSSTSRKSVHDVLKNKNKNYTSCRRSASNRCTCMPRPPVLKDAP